MSEKKQNIILAMLGALMVSLVVYMVYVKETDYEWVEEVYEQKVVRLHERQEPTNSRGDFENIYEALLEDGSIQEVELKTYLSLKEGDTLTWTEYRNVLKKK